MTEYIAKSTDNTSFYVAKDDTSIGKLIYKGWFNFNARMELTDGSAYLVEPKGFWGTTIEIKEDGKLLAKFSMNWNGNIIIQTYFKDEEKGYVFKHLGIFQESFTLTNQEGLELLVVKPKMKWNTMNFEYQFTANENFESIAEKQVLLMIALHCANYYMAMMMGVV